jgi:hypothetical protein
MKSLFNNTGTLNVAIINEKADEHRQFMLLRFDDLKARGIVGNHAQLARLIKDHGFPAGRWLSRNAHVWTPAEIDSWMASRPTERPAEAAPAKRCAAQGSKVRKTKTKPANKRVRR